MSNVVSLSSYASSLAGPTQQRRLDKEELAEWIREKSSPSLGLGRCRSFRLDHDSSEGRGRTAITHFVLPKKATEAECAEILDKALAEFDRASENFAATYPSPQRFFVGAVIVKTDQDDKSAHAECEFPFLVTPPEGTASSFHQRDEETNLPAIVGHLQRLVDRSIGLLATNMQEDKDRLVTLLEKHMTHNDALLERCYRMATEREEALNSHALREVQVAKSKMDLELTHKLYMALTNYGLAFLKKYLEAKGDSSTKETSAVVESLKDLDPPHLLEFVNVVNGLPEPQKERLAPIFALVVDSLDQEKKEKLNELLVSEMQRQAEETKK
jgi:hypothetical protein